MSSEVAAEAIRAAIRECASVSCWGRLAFAPGEFIYDVASVVAVGDSIRILLRQRDDGTLRTIDVYCGRGVRQPPDGSLIIESAAEVRIDGQIAASEPPLGPALQLS